MRKLFFIALFFILSLCVCSAQQDYKDFMKERKEMTKFTKEQLSAKALKDARKSAKTLKKEGWKVAPGALPLEKQLDKVHRMQQEVDLKTGFPLYIRGEAMSVGGNYDAAKMQAVNLAKIELAGNISTEIAALIETTVGNEQMTPEEAVSTTESVMGAKSMIVQGIGRTIIALEVYRDLNNGNKEVRVMLFYNFEMAKMATKQAVQEDLKAKGDNLVKQLDKMLGL